MRPVIRVLRFVLVSLSAMTISYSNISDSIRIFVFAAIAVLGLSVYIFDIWYEHREMKRHKEEIRAINTEIQDSIAESRAGLQ